ncbi:chromosome segregation protein [Agrobacterium sp. DSM 25558]|uniref:AAA family ATPase n=1 Tax=Agrobacterium sp. DSM 25558 TaxID=1907665 RepID=UPI0009724B19|nr:AAA family ATPase [Agrobacterium sp. DSM 25558]SCX28044.1 chromosome segregation protein [Agrobacterium sp. DSM 25558]
MWIESLRIDGGVLDGFNQKFSPGLNVIIGGRGTGKSSVIELLRYCVGARPYIETSKRSAYEHAVGVLRDGRVEATIIDGGDRITVSRTALEDANSNVPSYYAPFVFSQSEIEAIGLQSASRLRLIDDFLPAEPSSRSKQAIVARIKSITAEIRSLMTDAEDIEERLADLPTLRLQLETAITERRMTAATTEIGQYREQLEILSPQLTAANVENEFLSVVTERFQNWFSQLERLVEIRPGYETLPEKLALDAELGDLRKKQRSAYQQMEAAQDKLREVADLLDQRTAASRERLSAIENIGRVYRLKIEEQQVGASSIDRQIAHLTQQISVLETLKATLDDRKVKVASLSTLRASLLMEIDAIRQEVTNNRQLIVDRLNMHVSPSIRLTLEPFAQQRGYLSILAGALRGSGLRYNDLSERIVSLFSPLELAYLAETGDVAALGAALKISDERAYRVFSALKTDEALGLFTVDVEDDMCIELLDGKDYKPIGSLSTGQRCTAVLPIILAHDERPIILDQPEDHLDNAFVVKTLVRSLATRDARAQTIVATHNPNIPVLGDADRVIHMDSTGYNCFVRNADSLFSASVIDAISTIMEGGKEAFARRASFYRAPNDNIFN